MSAVAEEVVKPLKIDLGCGPNPKDGFEGADVLPFDGKVQHVLDLGREKWPWADDSVDEAHSSHFLEHLLPEERIHFANELYRVLKKGAKATVIVPHHSSERAYGDLTHKWPPVVGFWFAYLDADWRKANAPHNTAYTCDFKGTTWGFSLHAGIIGRHPEYQTFALTYYKEAAQDMIATLTK